jgi:hypothetical protein
VAVNRELIAGLELMRHAGVKMDSGLVFSDPSNTT